jgi:V/A-type H+-transporting ATPase subunit I
MSHDVEEAETAEPLPSSSLARLSPSASDPVALAEAELADIEPLVAPLAVRAKALEAEAVSLEEHQAIVERLLPVAEGIIPLEGFETVALLIQPSYRYAVDMLRAELMEITDRQCEVLRAEAPDGTMSVLVVFHRRYSEPVQGLLQTQRLSELHLPAQYTGRQLREVVDEIIGRRQEIPTQLEAVRTALKEIVLPRAGFQQAVRALLEDRLDELAVVTQCVETDYTFALAGWMPSRDFSAFQQGLSDQFDGRAVGSVVPTRPADRKEIPVLLENPRGIRAFELLMELFAPPRYGTIDPTPYLAFFFPLFFGFILGDVGYGLVLLALGLWVERGRLGPDWAQRAAPVIQAGSVVAIGFGLAFGEFFGDLGRSLGLQPLLMERSHAVLPLLLLSVGIGAVHVSLGLVLGVVNSQLQERPREALTKGATLAGLMTMLVLVGAIVGLLPSIFFTPTIVLLAIVAAVLVWSAGIAGPLEIVGTFGGILSYSRLVAVGLASVMLADVANRLAGLMGSALAGTLVGTLLHILNLVLALFSPSVQSLRLQYVEFFGRFYEPGGRPYRPFRCRVPAASLWT